MKLNKIALVLAILFLISACSGSSSNSQNESNSGTISTNEPAEQQQEETQPTIIESTPTEVGGGEISPLSFEIYEYKEGFTEGDHLLQEGAGWKSYHAKFRIIANQPVSGQYIISPINMNIGAINIDIDPYVVTKEGYNYGDTLETAFTINFDIPIVGQLDLFQGIPVGSSRSFISGNIREYAVNFSVPEKLTPEKIVIPTLDDSVILPPLGTEDTSEISLETNQIVDFPATVSVDPKINVKVSNIQQDENYIRIDYEIINTDIASNQAGFYYVALVDSYGFASRQIIDIFQPLSECPGEFLLYENITVGPGQTTTGKLCFSKNTGYQSSFYILYFSDTGTAGPDNKAILIKSSQVTQATESTSALPEQPSNTLSQETPTSIPSSTVTSDGFTCPNAPAVRVKVGDKARVVQDTIRLRTSPDVSDNIIFVLAQGDELEIIGEPTCYPRPDRSDFFVFWKVSVPSRGLEGWVAEGDSDSYYIEPHQ